MLFLKACAQRMAARWVLSLLVLLLSCCTRCFAQQCLYPCYLQNGCVCDHNDITVGGDGQNYGTCTSCNIGFTGFDCGSNVSPCVNGGLLLDNGTCECKYSWTGPHCGDTQCLNSRGGVGPNSVVPVNFETNQCDRCLPGYEGIACEMCTQDDQCGVGETCYRSTNYHVGYRKFIECDITDPWWELLLADGRPGVKAKAKMECNNYLAGCYISIWRLEPNNSWFDPFFYCSLSDCIVVEVDGESNTTITPKPPFADAVRYGLQGVLLFFVLLLELVSLLPLSPGSRGKWLAASGLAICFFLAVLVTFSVVYDHDEVHVTVINATTASYNCKSANCTCAKNPPNGQYTPICVGSYVGDNVLPTLKGSSSLLCNTVTNDCVFSQEQLGALQIPLQCVSSECSNQSAATPEYLVNNNASTVEESLSIVGGLLGLLVASYLLSRIRQAKLNREFHKTYDSIESAQRTPGPTSPINVPPQLHDGETSGLLLRTPIRTPKQLDRLLPFPSSSDDACFGQRVESLHVVIDHIQYKVSGREGLVLHDATLDFMSGELMAIVGPSGAGKTTLLDILARREKVGEVVGSITVNGTVVTKENSPDYRRMIGYVAQEDVLVPTLSVWDTIYFAARLKLPSTFPEDLVRSIVQSTISVLQLESCQHTLVGDHSRRGISGGEKRRVSIATELVANPRILFLDEPTSGLDSVSAVEVMKAVVNLTKRPPQNTYASFFDFQPAVVFSIHQPSSEICDMFDRVVLVSKGYVLYSGVASQAVERVQAILASAPALGSDNNRSEEMPKTPLRERSLCEQLLQLQHECSEPQFNYWAQTIIQDPSHIRQRPAGASGCIMTQTALSLKYYPHTWNQIMILSRRTWAALLGANYLLTSHAAATVFLSLALSFLYNEVQLTLAGTEDKAGMMTFLLLVIAFSSLSSLDLFISEKKLFCSERENGYYSTGAYFIVKVMFDLVPLRIVPTLLLSSSIYYPMGLRIDGSAHFLWFLLITTMFSMFVTAMCFCVAIVAPTFGTAALVSALIILWYTVFGGLMIQSKSIPSWLGWFKFTSPFYYGYEALMVNELEGQQCVFNPSNTEGSSTGWSVPVACQQFLFNFGLDPRNFQRDVALLSALTLATLIFGCFLLWAIRTKH